MINIINGIYSINVIQINNFKYLFKCFYCFISVKIKKNKIF